MSFDVTSGITGSSTANVVRADISIVTPSEEASLIVAFIASGFHQRGSPRPRRPAAARVAPQPAMMVSFGREGAGGDPLVGSGGLEAGCC
jgi:hypothetical protein